MATKSILKNIDIKEKQLANTFIKALNEAEKDRYKPSKLSLECIEPTEDKIKEFFKRKCFIQRGI